MMEDHNLQNIRSKYWNLRHEAFINVHEIPDHKLDQYMAKVDEAEEQEINNYLKRKNKDSEVRE